MNFIFKIRTLASGPEESWNSDGPTPQECPPERMLNSAEGKGPEAGSGNTILVLESRFWFFLKLPSTRAY